MEENSEATRAVVVFSGGQDSTTCLGWARNRYDEVEAITFDYGQNHRVELAQARIICQRWGIPQRQIDVGFYGALVDSALTSRGDVSRPHARLAHLPASFVPNRNAFFLTIAHAYAQAVRAGALVTGVCQTDYSGYPDCRRAFVDQLGAALNAGADAHIAIETPLMALTKAATFALAAVEGVLDDVIQFSHTCYIGQRTMHRWGAGCGQCPACQLRARGWREYMDQK